MSTNSTTNSTEYPTSVSSFDALKYNLNEMLGWMLGNPTQSEIYLYSNIADVGPSGLSFAIFNQQQDILFKRYGIYKVDQTLADSVSNFFTYDGDIRVDTFNSSDYDSQFSKLDGIFGFSWLPWNVYGLQDASGNYCVRRYFYGPYIKANPLCKGVLYIKMFTILKLLGISTGTYALTKLLIHYIERRK